MRTRRGLVVAHRLEQVLRDLSGLPGAGLALDDEHLVVGDRLQELLAVREDGQLAPLLGQRQLHARPRVHLEQFLQR